nr:isoamylase [Longimycelium tulufanense]
MIHMRQQRDGRVRVTFVLPADDPDGPVSVVGNFNDWTPGRHLLRRRSNGTRSAVVMVTPGSNLLFRYLGSDGYWFDDEHVEIRDGANCMIRA